MKPPVAKRIDHHREHHGDVFVDPYEWLREKASAEVIEHLEAENAYTEHVTADLAPLRQQIFDEIKLAPRRPTCRFRPGAGTGGITAAASPASSTGCNAVAPSPIPPTGPRPS